MPAVEPKLIQKEIEGGLLSPVYWLHGPERMKTRELHKRIRRAVLGEESQFFLQEETFDATETSMDQICDAAQSLSLGGGTRFITIQNAESLKEVESLSLLLSHKKNPRHKKEELSAVCVFIAKDLDKRTKSSKWLLEHLPVIACEEVLENDRDPWISYLSKRRGLTLSPTLIAQLRVLEPWSLEIIDQELEKMFLGGEETLQVGSGELSATERFVDAVFSKKQKETLELIPLFSENPDLGIPMLGLLNWNLKQLVLGKSRYGSFWKKEELLYLQQTLAEMDFEIKQTAKSSLGIWTKVLLLISSNKQEHLL